MDTKAAFDREAFEAWFEKEGHEELCGSSNVGAMIKHIAKSSWQASRAAIEIEPTKKLIGWRMADYTEETTDPEKAKNWAMAVGVLPIFEGDVNTSLTTSHGIRINGKTE